ncbi:hypothetical protein COOONC_23992 [Cooperia oncophora]
MRIPREEKRYWVALVGRQSLELAFTNYRFWESIGLAAGFAMSRLFSVEVVLITLFCLLLLGMIGYCAIELYDDVRTGHPLPPPMPASEDNTKLHKTEEIGRDLGQSKRRSTTTGTRIAYPTNGDEEQARLYVYFAQQVCI